MTNTAAVPTGNSSVEVGVTSKAPEDDIEINPFAIFPEFFIEEMNGQKSPSDEAKSVDDTDSGSEHTVDDAQNPPLSPALPMWDEEYVEIDYEGVQ